MALDKRHLFGNKCLRVLVYTPLGGHTLCENKTLTMTTLICDFHAYEVLGGPPLLPIAMNGRVVSSD